MEKEVRIEPLKKIIMVIIMAIKGELLKKYTENQLRNCGKVGMYRFNEVINLSPEQAEEIVNSNEILYLNKHEMHEFGVNRLVFKRDEIKNEPDALKYCGRFEFFNGVEYITIQEIHPDTVKCKIIGPKKDIKKLRQQRMHISKDLTDDEFVAMNSDVLQEVKFIKGYFNKPRDEVDVHGLHISKIEDYDNYSYAIYASQRYVYQIYSKEDKERRELREKENTIKWLKIKLKNYEDSLYETKLSRIKRVIKRKEEFVNELEEYDWTQTEYLIRDMKYICQRHKVGFSRAWKVWKFIMIPKIQDEIHRLENEIGEYSINDIRINMKIPEDRNSIEIGGGKMNWLTGVVK